MPAKSKLVVFVHGWSVTNTDTYGGLPERLAAEAAAAGLSIDVRHVYLGKYISFRDEVRVEDISRAFEAAVKRELAPLVRETGPFACITHSTGGPVIRDWLRRYYVSKGKAKQCPLSHLVMLAPANFGSALAQLGKGRLSRIKAFFDSVEPGAGVLDWLELGSADAWDLNVAWIKGEGAKVVENGMFPFSIIGQSIDRKVYDNLNTYTGENGSDGVVRVAAANLNAGYVRLEQTLEGGGPGPGLELRLSDSKTSRKAALRVVHGKSHSGARMGIMRSVKAKAKPGSNDAEVVGAVLECLKVRTAADYDALCARFDAATDATQVDEHTEVEDRILRDRVFIHDRCSMLIFRLEDEIGRPIEDFDLVLTAGPDQDPNLLPKGFCLDRQRNSRQRNAITYYLDYDLMVGCDAVMHDDKEIREQAPGVTHLGLKVFPRPDDKDCFVHYSQCELRASTKTLKQFLRPNQTTLVQIVLRRVVHEGVFRLDRGFKPGSFKKDKPGAPI